MVGADSHRISRVPWYLGKRPGKPASFRLRDDRPLWLVVPDYSAINPVCNFPAGRDSNPAFPRYPEGTTRPRFNIPPVWAFPSSLAATGGIARFLFLGVVRCFTLPRSLPGTYGFSSGMLRRYSERVSPFGHPRVNAYLQLTGAYRSLSRPSSPFGAKASTVRPL